MEILEQFKEHISKIEKLQHAAMILSWDMECSMPKNGVDAHIASLTFLSSEAFKLIIDPKIGGYLDELTKTGVIETLSEIDRKMVEDYKEDYDKVKNVPVELQERMTEVTSRSQHEWVEAKKNNDFETMCPYFEEIIKLQKEMASYTDPDKDPYDALLDGYEKGMTAHKIADIFEQLKKGILPLIEKIKNKSSYDEKKLAGNYPKSKQEELSQYLLKVMKYDFDSGVLDESEHPFTSGSAPYDVRITTRYDETDILSSAFSILHEGGHAIYEQHISPNLVGTSLNAGTSMGIHESQSRFYENIIGRSKAFWSRHYKEIVRLFPQYGEVSLDEFYKIINKVEPSLIRIEADELTYNMHIIIRFELERALFNGSLEVKDLPKAWNNKMQEYLGVQPTNDKEGVLQDVHWPGGMFGYFPSYALGNIYGGQFLKKIEEELGTVDKLLEEGKLELITDWLGQHIHKYGKMKTPTQIIEEISGGEIDAEPIIAYYNKKYTEIYGL